MCCDGRHPRRTSLAFDGAAAIGSMGCIALTGRFGRSSSLLVHGRGRSFLGILGGEIKTLATHISGSSKMNRPSSTVQSTPMSRRLFNFVSAGSLVLCLATSVICVRSYWVRDDVWFFTREHHIQHDPSGDRQWWRESFVRTSQGEFTVGVDEFWQFVSTPIPWYQHEGRAAFPLDGTTPVLAIWPVSIAALVAPAVWFVTVLRRRKDWRETGRCQCCAYDLRATPRRCPECGNVPNNAPSATVKDCSIGATPRGSLRDPVQQRKQAAIATNVVRGPSANST